jgi:hypothetical protein
VEEHSQAVDFIGGRVRVGEGLQSARPTRRYLLKNDVRRACSIHEYTT